MSVKIGHKSRSSLVYRCSNCGNEQAFLAGQMTCVCPACAVPDHYWDATDQELVLVTRDRRKELVRTPSRGERFSDWVMAMVGSIYFVHVHMVWFGAWIVYNLAASSPFDPYPFGLLTMIVSLEAIILAALILIAQNRQSEVSDMRARLDYQADVLAQHNTDRILTMLKQVREKMGITNGDKVDKVE
jgi:uncharacterized membrane protein